MMFSVRLTVAFHNCDDSIKRRKTKTKLTQEMMVKHPYAADMAKIPQQRENAESYGSS